VISSIFHQNFVACYCNFTWQVFNLPYQRHTGRKKMQLLKNRIHLITLQYSYTPSYIRNGAGAPRFIENLIFCLAVQSVLTQHLNSYCNFYWYFAKRGTEITSDMQIAMLKFSALIDILTIIPRQARRPFIWTRCSNPALTMPHTLAFHHNAALWWTARACGIPVPYELKACVAQLDARPCASMQTLIDI